jgi:hypothetical protein
VESDFVMVIVLACPRTVVLVEIETEDALAMSVHTNAEFDVTVCVATMPADEQVAEIFPEAIVFFPSEPCVTVVVPDAIFTDSFLPHEYWLEEEYALSRTVTLSMTTLHPIFTVLKFVLPLSSHTS